MRERLFKADILSRDKFTCKICGKHTEIAVQIISKNAFANGGFVLENGISLCKECVEKVSRCYVDDEKYSASALYKLIGSSFDLAFNKDEEE